MASATILDALQGEVFGCFCDPPVEAFHCDQEGLVIIGKLSGRVYGSTKTCGRDDRKLKLFKA